MQAIQIEAFGNPAEVMKVVGFPMSAPRPQARWSSRSKPRRSIRAISLMIAGRYGYRPKLPSVMGTEGVGRGLRSARRQRLKAGDRTLSALSGARMRNESRWIRSRLGRCRGGDVISSPCWASIRQPPI